MDDDKEKKQNFLRKEILEKNYDAGKFEEYLMSAKDNGILFH